MPLCRDEQRYFGFKVIGLIWMSQNLHETDRRVNMIMGMKAKTDKVSSCRKLLRLSGYAAMFLVLAITALLSACGGSGSKAASAVISSFTAASTSIAYGGSTTLAWSVSGATSVAIDNGVGTLSGSTGSVTVKPTATTTYTLTATNSAGAVITATVKVAVGPQITASHRAPVKLQSATAQL